MRSRILPLLLSIFLFSITSCQQEDIVEHDDIYSPEKKHSHTVIVFFPWNENLTNNFERNILDMEKAVVNHNIENSRIIIVMSSSASKTNIIEIIHNNRSCYRDTLLTYHHATFKNKSNIARMISDIQNIAPSKEYSLIIGGHGMGWIPSSSIQLISQRAAPLHYTLTTKPLTRWFGGFTSDYQIDIVTLAEAISESNIYFRHILFDGCYMASIEAAYELRHATDYLIASPTETMAYGIPYHLCLQYLTDNINYDAFCKEYASFYTNYAYPSGTISVIDCRQLEPLADFIKHINQLNIENNVNTNSLQSMDGYTPSIFYDFSDYIRHKTITPYLLSEYDAIILKVIPYSYHTNSFYSAINGWNKINTCSGVTTSEPSTNPLVKDYEQTSWYINTH